MRSQFEPGEINARVNEINRTNIRTNRTIVPEGAVWADVIGVGAAYMQLIQITGFPTGETDFYEMNKTIIDTYFRTGTYALDLARILGAAPEEMHPDIPFKEVNSQTDEVANDDSDVNEMKTT